MTDEENAMPPDWASSAGEVDKEYENECSKNHDLSLPKDVADAILSTRKSDYHKYVTETIFKMDTNSKCEFLRYAMFTPQHSLLFFYLNRMNGTAKEIKFKQDLTYDLGNGRKLVTKDECDTDKTISALVKEFDGNAFIIPLTRHEIIFVIPGLLVSLSPCDAQLVYDITNRNILERVLSNLVWKDSYSPVKMIDYVVFSNNAFCTTSLAVKRQRCDIAMNYNDDIPDERIYGWINSSQSGLMVLHGEPGTGKTSYIRNLIYRTKKHFMFFDKSLFHHMSDSSLIDMLLEHRDSIIVLEDCEDLLTDRTGLGSCMTTILNLTDGIIGDSMKFKFICTFNADVEDIDPAILRKGRMHLKYEFKKLDADKVIALGKKLGVEVPHEEMTLCDVYNFAVDNGKPQEKVKTKVGF